MTELLQLSQLTPLAQGRMRLVFEHPRDPDSLIKVIRPDVIERRWGSGAAWYKRRRRYGRYTSYLREIQEYIAAYASHGVSLPFAQRITGLIETDMGLGLVMTAVRDSSGQLAPPLSALLRNNLFDEKAQGALEWFFQELLGCDLIVADLNLGNMVYTDSGPHGHHFVLIDGLGVSTVLPFKLLSRSFNRRSKRRCIQGLRERIQRTRLRLQNEATRSPKP